MYIIILFEMPIFWENTININCHHQCRLQALNFAQTCEHSISFKVFISFHTCMSSVLNLLDHVMRQWLTWFVVAKMKILTVVKLRSQKYYPYKASGSGAIINSLWLELPFLEQTSWSKMFLSWRCSNVKVSGPHNHFAKSPFRMLKDIVGWFTKPRTCTFVNFTGETKNFLDILLFLIFLWDSNWKHILSLFNRYK